jgi:hypothetical protein
MCHQGPGLLKQPKHHPLHEQQQERCRPQSAFRQGGRSRRAGGCWALQRRVPAETNDCVPHVWLLLQTDIKVKLILG